MSSPISFLSDFGLQDEFVGVVHGVLARVSPLSRVIDVTHNIKPGDIRGGALALTRAVQYLPEGVVMAVVDPGVGTSRRALAALTAVGYFVGPDNGLLSPAVAMVGGASVIHSIENPEIKIPGSGATFHGRDLFAPAAGLLAAGEATLADLGPELAPDSVTPLVLPLPKVEPPVVIGEAWWVDRFGNVQTNVGPEDLALIGAQPNGEIEVVIGASSYRGRWRTTFGDSPLGDLILHVDSAGLIALAIRGGRADEELHLEEGLAVAFRAAPGQPEKI